MNPQSESEVLPQYYAFRWLTTLMAREFVLPDVQRLWDSLFADEQRFQLLVFCGVAMISLSKEYLLEVCGWMDGIDRSMPTVCV
jgi:hypothetical protein